ncbi:uncharacterized protein LOC122040258 isoform X2 [Zingiber officinale]|uniref:uncharacterized protein LOC122040258 isoform X2 n=1 Tax=Zingiber officinale TaxID=94328 RepID=UPI001C4D411B|nr:uncharacterized protein LOC122040258 isoform X2 [Zingiber officinale]
MSCRRRRRRRCRDLSHDKPGKKKKIQSLKRYLLEIWHGSCRSRAGVPRLFRQMLKITPLCEFSRPFSSHVVPPRKENLQWRSAIDRSRDSGASRSQRHDHTRRLPRRKPAPKSRLATFPTNLWGSFQVVFLSPCLSIVYGSF